MYQKYTPDHQDPGNPDIRGREDVERLVAQFYGAAFADPLLGPVFIDIARMDLAEHLPVMCDFWETVLFRAGLYRRNAFTVHAELHSQASLGGAHFARWLALWTQTVDLLHSGEKAELAKEQARRIAWSLDKRLNGGSGSEFVTIHRRPRRT
ncbi:group III truncated hemoglobin [Streptomyces olivochromogenes]|uniref:group III truncated hemoglobin n=1 Tax=Streptomyces olivochromogenes TaxID=1963 RepID=UPI001F328E47|nr:group III truncated hemoglobin [Streptomyces olivochromogenes]MCF3131105.1 group III truncated hemoglobin [Streptomyces olivochromogenes]